MGGWQGHVGPPGGDGQQSIIVPCCNIRAKEDARDVEDVDNVENMENIDANGNEDKQR